MIGCERINQMPRIKKEGSYINCKIKQDIYDKLNLYSEYSMIPKTALVERALEEYLNKAMQHNSENKQF